MNQSSDSLCNRTHGAPVRRTGLANKSPTLVKRIEAGKTIIRGELKNGKLVDLFVTAEERRKDAINYLTSQSRR